MKKWCLLVTVSLIICSLVGCGMSSEKTDKAQTADAINEEVEETKVSEEEIVEEETVGEDLSGIVPLSKRINKGKMVAFGCAGDIHNGYVFKIFFFEHGKVTVVSDLLAVGDYGGYKLDSLEELLVKTDEELWNLCDNFKKNSEEYVEAIKANSENAFNRLTDPNSPDYDLSFAEAVEELSDSAYLYEIILPVIDAPFAISIETDETNSTVQLEQIIIAAKKVSKTYGGTVSTDGAVDADLCLTNMAEGGEVEIGSVRCSAYPVFETNLSCICLREGEGFYFDSLDTPNIYINNKENAYEDASKLLVD